MTTYKYTDSTNSVVHIIDADGVSRSSMFASALPAGTKVLPADPEPVVVPDEVTRFQARAALLQFGLLDDVEALVNNPDGDPLLRMAWQDALTFKRSSSFVQAMAQTLDLSPADLDTLFLAAAEIE